jgi:hypothetical protein
LDFVLVAEGKSDHCHHNQKGDATAHAREDMILALLQLFRAVRLPALGVDFRLPLCLGSAHIMIK